MKSISSHYLILALMVVLPLVAHAEPEPKKVVIEAVSLVKIVLNDLPDVGNQEVCDKFETSDKAQKISPELTIKRTLSPFMDKCLKSLPNQKFPQTFEDAIRMGVDLNFDVQENMLSKDILETYDVETKVDPTNATKLKWNENVGLFTHPMCENTDFYLISRNQDAKKSRIKNAEKNMKELIQGYNKVFYELKNAVAAKKPESEISALKQQIKEYFFVFMSSMAVHESLGDANNKQQKKLAEDFSKSYGMPAGYVRPPGVKFYYDPAQDDVVSKQNIGLYQFTPKIGGNIDACYNAWNNIMGKKSPACVINHQKKNKLSFEFVAASDQIFNAFCGANKLVQSFGVQVNARHFNKPGAKVMQLTHADNQTKKGLKPNKDRCVSPFVSANNAYMHFGVMGFTVGTTDSNGKESSNTQGVISSALDAMKEE